MDLNDENRKIPRPSCHMGKDQAKIKLKDIESFSCEDRREELMELNGYIQIATYGTQKIASRS